MRKKTKIVLITFGVIIVIVFAGYQVGKWYIFNQAKKVLTSERVEQIDALMQEIVLSDHLDEIGEIAAKAVQSEVKEDDEVSAEAIAEVIQPEVKEDNEVATVQNAEPEENKEPKAEKLDIEAVKAQVPLADQTRGMQLISKVDVGYVLNLTKPGLTPEVKSELKSYLNERYTQAELQEVFELYNKYIHLLTN